MCASKLALVLRRFDVVAAAASWEHFCMTPICVSYVCRFPLWSVRYLMCVIVGVFFSIGVLWPGRSGCQVFSRFAKVLAEGKRFAFMCMDSGLVERRYHREHVQAIREFVGIETTKAIFCMNRGDSSLERKDVCHQFGFGPWSSLCDSRSAWLCKSLARRVWWLEIGMSVSSQNSEYVVRFTTRQNLEPQES